MKVYIAIKSELYDGAYEILGVFLQKNLALEEVEKIKKEYDPLDYDLMWKKNKLLNQWTSHRHECLLAIVEKETQE